MDRGEPSEPDVPPKMVDVEPDTSTPPVAEPEWPFLSLSAIVGRSVTGSAIINGTIVSVGESIEGVTLVIIGDQGVELEFEGKRRTLRVGQSTE